MGDAAYREDWDGRLHVAATRIVECIPKALGVVASRRRIGLPAGVSRRRASTRGLIAVPWTLASLSLLPEE
jgi:hypothetical protein